MYIQLENFDLVYNSNESYNVNVKNMFELNDHYHFGHFPSRSEDDHFADISYKIRRQLQPEGMI